MSDRAARIRSQFVTMQLTLLSIVIALILENLLTRAPDLPFLSLGSAAGWLTWLEITLVVTSALATWAGFGIAVGSPTRIPAMIDWVAPLLLLATLSAAIRWLHPESVVGFLAASAAGSAAASALLFGRWRAGEAPLYPLVLQVGLALWLALGALVDALAGLGMAVALAWVALAALPQAVMVVMILIEWQRLSRDDPA